MSKDWKSNLLSSSFPLEYEVAKILVSHGYAVSSDYKYLRKNKEGQPTEFSIDIEATLYDEENLCTNSFLIECKHRHHNTKWLFLPDPNKEDFIASFGNSLRVIDEFSYKIMDGQPFLESEYDIPLCIKGIELFGDNNAADAKIREGITQLQYCLPQFFASSVWFNINGHSADNLPFIFCPILLTTAELIIVSDDFSIDKVEKSNDLSDLGKSVPYLILYSEPGPEFETHCSYACESLGSLTGLEQIDEIEQIRNSSKNGGYESDYPTAIGDGLAAAQRFYLNKYFSSFIVCNLKEFPNFISKINDALKASLDNIKTRT